MRDGTTLDAFVSIPHLLVTERGDATGAVDEALGRLRLERRVAMTVSHVLVVPSVLAQSDLIATIGARAAWLCPTLAVYGTPVGLPPWRLSMLWSRQKAGDAGLVWLRERLLRIGAQV